MQWLMKCCAQGALVLGAAALLLAGVPAHAGPAPGASVLAPAGGITWQGSGFKEQGQWQPWGRFRALADASRESQPLLLVQSTAQQEEADKLKQQRLKEQQEREKLQQQEIKQPRKMRSLEKSAPVPEAAPAPPKAGSKRFGAGVVRHGDPGEAE